MNKNQENIWTFLSNTNKKDMPKVIIYIGIIIISYFIFVTYNLQGRSIDEMSGFGSHIKASNK